MALQEHGSALRAEGCQAPGGQGHYRSRVRDAVERLKRGEFSPMTPVQELGYLTRLLGELDDPFAIEGTKIRIQELNLTLGRV